MMEAVDLKGNAMVVLSREEFDRLVEDAGQQALADAAALADEGKPVMPSDLVLASLDGRLHPLAAWRQAVGLTQAALAEKSGVRAATISDIEAGKIDPRLSTLRALATALGLGVEDIID